MELVLENVTKKYKDKTAVCNISTELTSGQLIGLIGKNGAGKTTLMKMLATIIKPTSGQILFDGKNTVKNPNIVRNTIGYLPQEVSVYPNPDKPEKFCISSTFRLQLKKNVGGCIDVTYG